MPVRRPLTASAAAALLCLVPHSRVFTSPSLPLRPTSLPRLRRTATWSSGGREMNDVLRSVSGKAVAEQKVAASGVAAGTVTPEEAMQRLMQAAGPGAGSPPPEVVGAALKATNVAPTAENVQRALVIALGGAAPTATQVETAMRTASDGLPDNFFESPVPEGAAAAGSPPKPTTPEEVVEVLKTAAGPSAGQPPADVVGTALRRAGLEITAENVIRALKAANPGSGEPSSKDLGDALKAAMAEPGPTGYGVGPTSSQLPGAAPQAGAPQAGAAGAPPASLQTPEEVVRALLQIAGSDAGQPPPEILGTALQASGLPVTRDNVLRALRAAAVGGGSPSEEDVQKALAGAQAPATAQPAAPATPEEVIFALRMAAGPGAGTPPPEVVGAALHQAKATSTKSPKKSGYGVEDMMCSEPLKPADVILRIGEVFIHSVQGMEQVIKSAKYGNRLDLVVLRPRAVGEYSCSSDKAPSSAPRELDLEKALQTHREVKIVLTIP